MPTPEELALLEEERRRQAEMMRMQFEHNEMGLLGEEREESSRPNRMARPVQRMTLSLGNMPTLVAQTDSTPIEENAVFEPPASRNSPCPCGSGLKYKQCHGKLA